MLYQYKIIHITNIINIFAKLSVIYILFNEQSLIPSDITIDKLQMYFSYQAFIDYI